METTVDAHMPGMVARVVVNAGDTVAEGQEVAVLSVMKIELSVESHVAGIVREVLVKEWDEIDVGMPLVVVDTA